MSSLEALPGEAVTQNVTETAAFFLCSFISLPVALGFVCRPTSRSKAAAISCSPDLRTGRRALLRHGLRSPAPSFLPTDPQRPGPARSRPCPRPRRRCPGSGTRGGGESIRLKGTAGRAYCLQGGAGGAALRCPPLGRQGPGKGCGALVLCHSPWGRVGF